MTTGTRLGRLILAPALALAAAGCVIDIDGDQVVVREDQRFAVGDGAELTLQTFDGSIRVEAWDQAEVLVEVQKRGPDKETAAALEVRATQEGNRVRVEAPAPRVMREVIGIGRHAAPSVSFLVRVPARIGLAATTRDGSIVVEGVRGAVDLRSGDGSIRADRLAGPISVQTGDGSVSLSDVEGRVALETGDGSIRASGTFAGLRAKTGDGSIAIEAADGSAMSDDWDISTGDGSITFRVPPAFDAEIDADSRDGRVRGDVEGLAASRDDRGRGTLRGRLGSGGHTVRLRSGDGSIAVLRR